MVFLLIVDTRGSQAGKRYAGICLGRDESPQEPSWCVCVCVRACVHEMKVPRNLPGTCEGVWVWVCAHVYVCAYKLNTRLHFPIIISIFI